MEPLAFETLRFFVFPPTYNSSEPGLTVIFCDFLGACVGVSVGSGDGVCDGSGVMLGDGSGVGVCVGTSVGSGVTLGVASGVGVCSGGVTTVPGTDGDGLSGVGSTGVELFWGSNWKSSILLVSPIISEISFMLLLEQYNLINFGHLLISNVVNWLSRQLK